ncbi:MAG: radical SAM protein [Promethearchaeia archaeon]
MSAEIIYVDDSSQIPLFGIDFLGIIDRGTNILEIKPTTICNLNCRYCFVNAGEYKTNFIVDLDYLLKNLRKVIEYKGAYDMEIHIAPYGESLLYPHLVSLIEKLWKIPGIARISVQSNGVLLNQEIIEDLANVNLTRINLSLNTLNEDLACYLCGCQSYNIAEYLQNIRDLLEHGIDVLLAPVWFPGENDTDIEEIIQLVLKLRGEGYSDSDIQIGIQKYLIYKTGRRLKKIQPKTWGYFYRQLQELEDKYQLQLKLGPEDFDINDRKKFKPYQLQKGDRINAQIISKGRFPNECIGKISNYFGIKILLRHPYTFTDQLKYKHITARVIKANYKYNLITALFPDHELPI